MAVAAPIAMVGYSLPIESITVRLPAAVVARPGRQLYRFSTTWVSADGTSQVRQPSSYVYVTPGRQVRERTGATTERQPDGSTVAVCPLPGPLSDPFSPAAQEETRMLVQDQRAGRTGRREL